MRVWERMHAQLQTEKAATQAVPAQVGGRGVLLVRHREAGTAEDALPPDYQQIMKIARADEPRGQPPTDDQGHRLSLANRVSMPFNDHATSLTCDFKLAGLQ